MQHRPAPLSISGILSLLLAVLLLPGAATSATSAEQPSKKGVAAASYSWSNTAKLTALKPSWFYNWSPAAATVPGAEFVPMVWDPRHGTDSVITDLTRGAQSGKYRTLLTFNEPDLVDQANVTPEQAIAAWPRLQSTGLRLSSPAPAVANGGWLDRFMALAKERNLRVDFIALHYYLDFTSPHAVAWLKADLEAVHAKHGKPIWVTELGTIDQRTWGMTMTAVPTHDAADTYMKNAVTMLESLPFVERYAWFADNCADMTGCEYSTLYDSAHNLTSHGRLYASLPSPPAPAAPPIRGAASNRCIDVPGAHAVDGAAVQLYDCNGTPAQRWEAAAGNTLQALGKCLDVAGNNTWNGNHVQLWTCNGGAAQKWTLRSDGSIVHAGSGKCLDARDLGTWNGTRLQIWDCAAGQSNQRWSRA